MGYDTQRVEVREGDKDRLVGYEAVSLVKSMSATPYLGPVDPVEGHGSAGNTGRGGYIMVSWLVPSSPTLIYLILQSTFYLLLATITQTSNTPLNYCLITPT